MEDTKDKGLATEMLGTLKKVIVFQWVAMVVLILIIAGQSFYHDYKWSEFDAVVVDSGNGGNANYIGNDGDVIYGESGSTQEKDSVEQ